MTFVSSDTRGVTDGEQMLIGFTYEQTWVADAGIGLAAARIMGEL